MNIYDLIKQKHKTLQDLEKDFVKTCEDILLHHLEKLNLSERVSYFNYDVMPNNYFLKSGSHINVFEHAHFDHNETYCLGMNESPSYLLYEIIQAGLIGFDLINAKQERIFFKLGG